MQIPPGGCSLTKEGGGGRELRSLSAGHKPFGLQVRQHTFKASLIYAVSCRQAWPRVKPSQNQKEETGSSIPVQQIPCVCILKAFPSYPRTRTQLQDGQGLVLFSIPVE